MTTSPDNSVIPLAGGTSIPELGFGTWALRGTEARENVRTALEVGYRHIDTATAYGNEDQVAARCATAASLATTSSSRRSCRWSGLTGPAKSSSTACGSLARTTWTYG